MKNTGNPNAINWKNDTKAMKGKILLRIPVKIDHRRNGTNIMQLTPKQVFGTVIFGCRMKINQVHQYQYHTRNDQ